LIAGRLGLSFQRYPEPQPNADERRRSCGALPVGHSAMGELLVPLAAGEAVWIGLSRERPEDRMSVRIRFRMADRRAKPKVHAEVEHHTAIEGVPTGAARSLPIVREPIHPQYPACSGLIVALVDPVAKGGRSKSAATRASVEVRLTDYDAFVRETGLPTPAALDAASAYGDHLLP
jgi:hypothetical protein